MTRTRRRFIGTLAALAAIGGGTLVAVAPSEAHGRPLSVEVAETGSRFYVNSIAPDKIAPPVRGDTFVTEGYVYPEGTVTCTEGHCNGVLYDAAGTPRPEFPDKVIGHWTCYGTFVSDAATTTTGKQVITDQVFEFGRLPGEHSITTSGFELADVGVVVDRAVTGGTGRFVKAVGQQRQELLGLNNWTLPIMGVTHHVEFDLR